MEASISHKKQLNELLDQVLARERLRSGYSEKSIEVETMTDQYLLADLLEWHATQQRNSK